MPKHGAINLYVHGNQKARYDGQLRTATSTLTQLLNYDRVLNVYRNIQACWVRGEGRKGVWRWVKEGRLFTCRYTVTTRMTPVLRWAAMQESHFNISSIVRDKVKRQCPQTTTFEEKGEPKRIRTEVPLLTSLTPYR